MKQLAGKFIVLEGPEGCGKSTQAMLLRDHIMGSGVETVITREPGGTAIGEKIRDLLLDKTYTEMTVETELFLYMAARSQFIAETVQPALDAGKCVISERFLLSTLVYQGYAGGIAIEAIEQIAHVATRGLSPAATILLDIPAAKGLARAEARNALDRMESKGLGFHEKVRQGYLDCSKHIHPSLVISSEQAIAKIHEHIVTFLKGLAPAGN